MKNLTTLAAGDEGFPGQMPSWGGDCNSWLGKILRKTPLVSEFMKPPPRKWIWCLILCIFLAARRFVRSHSVPDFNTRCFGSRVSNSGVPVQWHRPSLSVFVITFQVCQFLYIYKHSSAMLQNSRIKCFCLGIRLWLYIVHRMFKILRSINLEHSKSPY